MIHPLTINEWKRFDALHPAPTFFARPAWSLALAYAYPHLRPYPVHVGDADGDVLIPLMQVSGGKLGWRAFVGMPLGSYTCGLHHDGSVVSPSEFSRALAAIGRACDSLTVTPWPLVAWEPMPAWRLTRHETAVIDLAEGADVALSGVSGVSRRMAGQALRNGVECEPCHSLGLGITTYHAILREASQGWGLDHPPFSKELIEGLITYGESDVEIWLAQRDGHPIAGGIVLYGSQELFFWSAAMRPAFSRLRPSNALNLALIQAAARRKMRWYNLGASEGLPGVERFKRGLGAQTVPYKELHRDGVAYAVYARLRDSLRRTRKTPDRRRRMISDTHAPA
jgi:hypothetical protein